jgi:hypothetical protein
MNTPISFVTCKCPTCGETYTVLSETFAQFGAEECSHCCRRRYEREWRAANPDKVAAARLRAKQNADPVATANRKAAWAKAHPEVGRAKAKRYRERHKEEVAAREKAYYEANRVKRIQATLDALYRKITPPWANMEAIHAKYEEARRLTEETGNLYEVDHIIPRKGKNVCGLHVENNLRVVTTLANRRKQRSHTQE